MNFSFPLAIIFLVTTTASSFAREWKIPWSSSKGDRSGVIQYAPQPLEYWATRLPAGHGEADEDIKSGYKPDSSKVEELGRFKKRKILFLHLTQPQGYYTRYDLILAEVEPDKYLPLFVDQHPATDYLPDPPKLSVSKDELTIKVRLRVSGTGGFHEDHTLVTDLKNALRFQVD